MEPRIWNKFAWTLDQNSGNKPLPLCDGGRKLWTASAIKAGVPKVWPAGQIRPFKGFDLALKMLIIVERSICFNTIVSSVYNANSSTILYENPLQSYQDWFRSGFILLRNSLILCTSGLSLDLWALTPFLLQFVKTFLISIFRLNPILVSKHAQNKA